MIEIDCRDCLRPAAGEFERACTRGECSCVGEYACNVVDTTSLHRAVIRECGDIDRSLIINDGWSIVIGNDIGGYNISTGNSQHCAAGIVDDLRKR